MSVFSSFGAMRAILDAVEREKNGEENQFVTLTEPENKKLQNNLSIVKKALQNGLTSGLFWGAAVTACSIGVGYFRGSFHSGEALEDTVMYVGTMAATGLSEGETFGIVKSLWTYNDLKSAAKHMFNSKERPVSGVPGFFEPLEPNDERLIKLHQSKTAATL